MNNNEYRNKNESIKTCVQEKSLNNTHFLQNEKKKNSDSVNVSYIREEQNLGEPIRALAGPWKQDEIGQVSKNKTKFPESGQRR